MTAPVLGWKSPQTSVPCAFPPSGVPDTRAERPRVRRHNGRARARESWKEKTTARTRTTRLAIP
eukprot:5087431-Pyramimonas_sp.AAC.1